MIDFKACPRCVGDVYYNSDTYGFFKECLQCGWLKDIEKSSKRNGNQIPLDKNIEILWLLYRRGHTPANDIRQGAFANTLDERLGDMKNYGYVSISKEENDSKNRDRIFEITQKGRDVVEAYKSFVNEVNELVRLKRREDGQQISSYELVDEDGRLTAIGRYVVKTSPTISQFVDDIYPMATISLERLETVQEEDRE